MRSEYVSLDALRRAASLTTIFGFLFIGWTAMAWAFPITRLFFSSPRSTAIYFANHLGQLARAAATTGVEAVAGIVLAMMICFVAFGALTRWPLVHFVLMPVATLSQVIPLITLAPLFVIALGPGMAAKVAMGALIAVFPLFIAASRSFLETPGPLRDYVDLYQPSWLFRFRRIHIPLALSVLPGALRVSTTLAVVGVLVAEMTGADAGLGKNLFIATRRLEPELLVSSVVLVCALGGLGFVAVVIIEKALRKRRFVGSATF